MNKLLFFLLFFSYMPSLLAVDAQEFLEMFEQSIYERKIEQLEAQKIPEVQKALALLQNPDGHEQEIFNLFYSLDIAQLQNPVPMKDNIEDLQLPDTVLKRFHSLIEKERALTEKAKKGYAQIENPTLRLHCCQLCDNGIEKIDYIEKIFKIHRLLAFRTNLTDMHPAGMAKTDLGTFVPLMDGMHIGQRTKFGTITAIKPKD